MVVQESKTCNTAIIEGTKLSPHSVILKGANSVIPQMNKLCHLKGATFSHSKLGQKSVIMKWTIHLSKNIDQRKLASNLQFVNVEHLETKSILEKCEKCADMQYIMI